MTLTELKQLVDFAFDFHNGHKGRGSDNVYIKVVDNPVKPTKLFDVQQLQFNDQNSANIPVIAIFPDSIIAEQRIEVPSEASEVSAEVPAEDPEEPEAPVEEPSENLPKRVGRPPKPRDPNPPPKRPPGRPKKLSNIPKEEMLLSEKELQEFQTQKPYEDPERFHGQPLPQSAEDPEFDPGIRIANSNGYIV